MYYDIGVVSYTPRIGKDTSDLYEEGEIVPIIAAISKENKYDWIIYWVENKVEGLRVGDTVAFDTTSNEMYELKVIEGLGVRLVDEDVLYKAERRASV